MEAKDNNFESKSNAQNSETGSKESTNEKAVPSKTADTPSFMDIGLGKDVLGNDNPDRAVKDMEKTRNNQNVSKDLEG